MKVLVIGQGGREHALTRAFTQSSSISEVHCIPGNDGIAQTVLCHNLNIKNHETIVQFCLRTEIDFVFIGPEDPLVDGLADSLRSRGILVVGPSQEYAWMYRVTADPAKNQHNWKVPKFLLKSLCKEHWSQPRLLARLGPLKKR